MDVLRRHERYLVSFLKIQVPGGKARGEGSGLHDRETTKGISVKYIPCNLVNDQYCPTLPLPPTPTISQDGAAGPLPFLALPCTARPFPSLPFRPFARGYGPTGDLHVGGSDSVSNDRSMERIREERGDEETEKGAGGQTQKNTDKPINK